MFPFRGTAQLLDDPIKEESDYDDNEWSTNNSKDKPVKLNNALGALMSAYSFGGYSDSEPESASINSVDRNVQKKVSSTVVNKDNKLQNNQEVDSDKITVDETEISGVQNKLDDWESSVANVDQPVMQRCDDDEDNEPPTEIKLIKQAIPASCQLPVVTNPIKCDTIKQNNKRSRRSKFSKNNQFNKRRKFNRTENKNSTSDFPYNTFRKRKATLLEKLLENEIRHERNILLQCVRYVVSNNFFRDSNTS